MDLAVERVLFAIDYFLLTALFVVDDYDVNDDGRADDDLFEPKSYTAINTKLICRPSIYPLYIQE